MSVEERKIFEDFVNSLETNMNQDVDPHVDFYEYANGNENPDSSTGLFDYVGTPEAINTMLEDESKSNPVLEKARNFLSSRNALLQDGVKEFLKSDHFIEFCGGVPMFNENWNAENFNWARTLGLLSAMKLTDIFYLIVGYLDDDTKVITVGRDMYMDFFFDDLDETLETLELNDEQLGDVLNDINVVIERYYNTDVDDETEAMFGRDVEDGEILYFKEFIETAMSITINDDDMIRLEPGIRHRISILSSFDPKTLANYAAVLAAMKFREKSEYTAFEVLTYFKPGLFSAAFELYYNEKEQEKLQLIVDMFIESFERVKDEFPANIRETRLFLFGTDFDQLGEHITEVYGRTKIVAEYEDLQILPDDFYQNLTNITNNRTPDSFKHFFHDTNDLDSYERFYSLHNLHEFVVEHYEKPLAFYFCGSLGFRFWIRVLNERFYEVPDEPYGPNENFLIPEEILRSQIAHRDEWIQDFLYHHSIHTLQTMTYAYSDYQKWMRENEVTVRWQDEMLSRINLDCRKLFFVCAAQQFSIISLGSYMSALMNFVDFIRVFEVGPDSPMNPRKFMLIN